VIVAELLRRIGPDEVALTVAMLTGEPRQGKVGVGARTLWSMDIAASDEPSLTLRELDQTMEAIGSRLGPGSRRQRLELLADVLGRATVAEQDFIRRLLVGELRQGALEGIVVEAVGRAAGLPAKVVRRALMFRADIGAVAEAALAGGRPALEAIRLQVLHPIRPMLASSAESVDLAMAKLGAASVEWKLDGIRVQVHRMDQEIRVYTRNLNDITGRVPDVVVAAQRLTAHHVVLDGEAIVLSASDRPKSFPETMAGLGADRAGGDSFGDDRLMPFFFDVLHLDGEDLVDRPLAERLVALDRVVPADLRITRVMAHDSQQAGGCMAEALQHGHEGVVVKGVAGLYDAGRRGSSWVKVKPAHTFDLVVLAVEWGHGRRRGRLSNLHLGARDGETGELVMVGKTFKGMTDEMLEWQTTRFTDLALDGTDQHVVSVQPIQVVEIAIDGVQASTTYPGGLSLRFARVKRYREDKGPSETDTLAALRGLIS